VVKVDLRKPMKEILAMLSQYPPKTRLSLTGTMIVARDLAHAKLRERLEAGRGCRLFQEPPIYYAGPAKTPAATPRLVRPTTAGAWIRTSTSSSGRGSMISLAKGNARRRCASLQEARGFYLASIAAARQARRDVHQKSRGAGISRARHGGDLEDRGRGFPAFIVIDDKGNDFFKDLNLG